MAAGREEWLSKRAFLRLSEIARANVVSTETLETVA
jgi:hypothetical protein